jgi:hypothetical protein
LPGRYIEINPFLSSERMVEIARDGHGAGAAELRVSGDHGVGLGGARRQDDGQRGD